MKLHHLNEGDKATIQKVHNLEVDLYRRILEMGFLEGADVEMLKKAPFGGDPIAVRIRGCVMGLRSTEANLIEVLKK